MYRDEDTKVCLLVKDPQRKVMNNAFCAAVVTSFCHVLTGERFNREKWYYGDREGNSVFHPNLASRDMLVSGDGHIETERQVQAVRTEKRIEQ